MSQRAKLLDKIRALLSKTESAGCTEAEAFAALAKAQQLMDDYNVQGADLHEPQEATTIESKKKTDRYRVRPPLATGIAHFLDMRAWQEGKSTISFAGPQGDIAFAYWLLDTLQLFCERGAMEYILTNPDLDMLGALDVDSFCYGCATRIKERLIELSKGRKQTAGSNALVVNRRALIDRELESRGIRLGKAAGRKAGVAMEAYGAGQAAGNRATFSRPVGSKGPGGPLLISRRPS